MNPLSSALELLLLRYSLGCLLACIEVVSAGELTLTNPVTEKDSFRLQEGMMAANASRHLGTPEEHTEIGAACGMLEVLSWNQGKIRLVVVDGIITSVQKEEEIALPQSLVGNVEKTD